jgi:hypothetical protein
MMKSNYGNGAGRAVTEKMRELALVFGLKSRGDRIRTYDLSVPNPFT